MRSALKCPFCKIGLDKEHYRSRASNESWWRVRCITINCPVDSGKSGTLEDAYIKIINRFTEWRSDLNENQNKQAPH